MRHVLELAQSPPDCVAHQTGRVVNAKLVHDPAAVSVTGLHTDAEQLCDLLRGLSFSDQLQHLPLTRRQRIRRCLSPGQIRVDDRSRYVGAEINLPAADIMNRLHEVRRRLRLDDVAPDAGAERLEHVLVFSVDRQEKCVTLRRHTLDFPCGFQTVEPWHREIEHGHVWTKLPSEPAIISFCCPSLMPTRFARACLLTLVSASWKIR